MAYQCIPVGSLARTHNSNEMTSVQITTPAPSYRGYNIRRVFGCPRGCGFGVAVFERIEAEQFNPNVSLEVGYMRALSKEVCLLKDKTLTTLQTDLLGKLYRQFDPQDPERTIPNELSRWLSDKGILAWDEPVAGAWIHTTSPRRRRMLARRMELENFDPAIAAEAIKHDLVIFVNDSYADYLARCYQLETYSFYLLAHECLHFTEDWSGKHLVVDDVPPWEDQQVVTTLQAYVEHVGGWNTFKQRYMDLPSSPA